MKRFYLLKLVVLVAILSGYNAKVLAQVTAYTTPGTYTYTVPAGVTTVLLDVAGAQGGTYTYGKGGKGGRVECVLQVSGGQVLTLDVGSAGGNANGSCCTAIPGGTPGGGNSGGYYYGCGGGGYSAVRNGGTRLVVAGGGGGGGYNCGSGNDGGAGGGLTGEGGYSCGSTSYSYCYNPTGGTQIAGGNNGTCAGGTASGSTGGNGMYYGAGGGGGYFGGGGAYYYSGGAGGSSFPAANGGNISGLNHTQGYETGNGYVKVCPGPIVTAVLGANTVCPSGGTTALSDATPGGFWSSSNVAIANVDAATGVVTGIIPGTVTISYSVSSSCATSVAKLNMTVLPKSTVYNVTGGGSYCPGAAGVPVNTDGCEAGVDYYLMNGTTVVKAGTCTGTGVDFGLVTSVGSLSVMAVSQSTACSLKMTGNAVVYTNPLPVIAGRNVTADGTTYCGTATSGTGFNVRLNTSDIGNSYQLWNASGAQGVAQAGTGAALDFGPQLAGTYTVVATSGFGCVANMPGNPVITFNPLPPLHNVTGGNQFFCGGPGAVGDSVGLDGSEVGMEYQLYLGAAPIGSPVAGTGGPLFFGLQTALGNYTVWATDKTKPTNCTQKMNLSSTINAGTTPNIYTVTLTNGGSYCANVSSNVQVQLSGSQTGMSYQLYSVPLVGAPVPSGTPITAPATLFGNRSAGTYMVVATSDPSLGKCKADMIGAPTIFTNPVPVVDTVYTPDGPSYCANGKGVHIGLKYSDMGIKYQLLLGGVPVGTEVEGTNSSLDLGLKTDTGIYTVRARNGLTSCKVDMAKSVTVKINPLPTPFFVSGGGFYCENGTGLPVGLTGSESTVNYQLYNQGNPIGSLLSGTGSAISFGKQLDSNLYTVVGINKTTQCTNNMTGSVKITVNPAPDKHVVTGGGIYCVGTSGVNIGLDNSDNGISYQLYNGASAVGAGVYGSTSSAIDFGAKTAVGTYTVKATNVSTTCTAIMNGSTTVNMSPAPTVYTVSGGGSYCFGDAGADIKLSFSNIGIDYQLKLNGTTDVGLPLSGTGALLDFGSQPLTGSYSVVATNTLSGCTKNMAGSVPVVVSQLPANQTVTADNNGNYCIGGSGVHIGVAGSATGVSYQLYLSTTPVGTYKIGNNKALDFGVKTAPGVYKVRATNATTGCAVDMANTITVAMNPLPNPYSVGGGGTFCTGAAGQPVTLSMGESGVTYKLYLNGVALTDPSATVAGTSTSIDFGNQSVPGIYTVVATDDITGCSGSMSGTSIITALPLPDAFTVTGGGAYCQGTGGKHIYLSGSKAGVSYQLFNGSADGLPLSGTGKSLDFGAKTAMGNYSVVATIDATGCSANMLPTVPLIVNANPQIDTMAGGGHYCAGTTGVPVSLKNSVANVEYQLYNGTATVGSYVLSTGGPINFGIKTAGGTYTVLGTDHVTHCSSNMEGFAKIDVDSIVVPDVKIAVKGGATSICEGDTVTYTTTNTGGGTFQWSVNGTPVTGAMDDTFKTIPAVGDVVSVELTSGAICPSTPTAENSYSLLVTPKVDPFAFVEVTDPLTGPVCPGTVVTYHAVIRTKNAPVTLPDGSIVVPTYQWFNGSGVPLSSSSANPFLEYSPADKDVIRVKVTPNETCMRSLDTTVSTTATVTPVLNPTNVKLSVTPGNSIKEGQLDSIVVSYTGAGTNPTFEWRINGVVVEGENTNMLIADNFSNHDSITCIVTGVGACGGNSVSASTTLLVKNTLVVNQLTGANTDIRIMPNPNKGAFTVKGTLANTDDQTVGLEVVNMLGQVVYKNNVATHNGIIDTPVQITNALANGMYILNVRSGSENSSFHFVIAQ